MREKITILVERFDPRTKTSSGSGWTFASTKMDSDPDGILWSLVEQLRAGLDGRKISYRKKEGGTTNGPKKM